nr:MAG TPA: hypothetical protein [Caudoviricetes sp.]
MMIYRSDFKKFLRELHKTMQFSPYLYRYMEVKKWALQI